MKFVSRIGEAFCRGARDRRAAWYYMWREREWGWLAAEAAIWGALAFSLAVVAMEWR